MYSWQMRLFKILNYVIGGDGRNRTDGLYVANVPLSQLSYIPIMNNRLFQQRQYYRKNCALVAIVSLY